MRAQLFVLFFLLPILLFAQTEISDPALAASVTSTVTKSGTIRALDGALRSVQLNLSAPQKTNWQLPAYSNPIFKDEEGNPYLIISDSSPRNPFTYSVSTDVLTKARVTDSLPQSYSVTDSLKRYLLPSEGIESNNPEIILLAKKITENSSSEFERAARLAIWVHQTIAYDEAMTGKVESAEWVLANRRGVCAEFTTLYIALARAAGIPARYISGYAYNSEKGWLGHAWAEVYIGDWVPVDPTWMEAGHLDATHIQMTSSVSAKTESYVSAYTTRGSGIDWTGSGTFGSNAQEVQVKNHQSVPADSDYSLLAGAGTLAFGAETAVYAKLMSDDYRVVDLSLLSCRGAGSPDVMDEDRFAILEPGKEKIVAWRVSVPSTLSRGYTYTCSLTMNSNYLSKKTAPLKMDDDAPRISFDAWLANSVISLGEEQAISVSSPSHQPGAKLTVIAEDQLFTFLASSKATEVKVTPSSPGEKEAWVFSNYGGVKKLAYSVFAGRSLSLGKLSISGKLVEGGELTASFKATVNSTTPKRIRASAVYSLSESTSYSAFSGTQEFNFTFKGLEPGERMLTVSLESEGERAEGRVAVSVQPKPWVGMKVSFSPGEKMSNATFLPTKTGEPRNIRAYLDGSVLPLSAGSGTVELLPGAHILKVSWQDSYGQEYFYDQDLTVPSKGTSIVIPTGGNLPCPSFLIAPLLFILAASASRKRTG